MKMKGRRAGGSPRMDVSSGQGDDPSMEGGPASKANHPKRQQEVLWREVLSLAAYVEAAFKTSVEVLCRGRVDLVDRVKAEEEEIDRWEVRIETECLRLLALFGLVASDLRRVVAALRINRELEGVADLAENLAKRARKLARDPTASPFIPRLCQLADEVLVVVNQSLHALATADAELARQVIQSNNGVGPRRSAIMADLKDAIRDEPEAVNTWLRLISSARNLHRAADHALNIAEAVVYLREGVFLCQSDDDRAGD